MELNPAARRLRAALAAVLVAGTYPELAFAHHWLDSWRGVGQITEGMHRAGWDLQLAEYGNGHWRATFYVTGQAHSIVGGTAWEPTPWTAVKQAAWEALRRDEAAGADSSRIISRHGVDHARGYPEVAGAIVALPVPTAVLDGSSRCSRPALPQGP